MDKPPFLKNNPATAPASASKDAFENRPQKMGGSNEPDGGSDKFPNRPQPMKPMEGNPKSVPAGGTLPFKGPSVPTRTPFKLGK